MSRTTWLSHLTVVETGVSPAARYCGWLFVQNGATVLTPERSRPDQMIPAAADFLDTGKVPYAATPGHPADLAIVDGHTEPDDRPDARLTGIVDVVSERGPRSGWVADELVLAAAGGAAAYTRGRAGEPVYGFGYRYQYLAGLYLYIALVARLSDPSPGEVRVSQYETVPSLLPYATTQFAYNGSDSLLEQSGPRFVVGCRDGWVVVYAGLAWPALVGMLQRPELADDPRFVSLNQRFRHVRELGALFDEWAATLGVSEVLAAGRAHDVATSEVRSPAEVLGDAELRGRDFWSPVDGGGVAPSVPYLVVSQGAFDVPSPVH